MRKKENYATMVGFLQQTKKNYRFEDRVRRRRKLAAAFGLALIMGMTGCAGKEMEAPTEDMQKGKNSTNAEVTQEGEWEREEPVSAREKEPNTVEENTEAVKEPEEKGEIVHASQGTEHMGGTVQSPREDGMTFARTTLLDEDGQVTMLDVEDAEKIQVKFTADTKVEHWTIQGGGAGIDMQDAAVSDLKEGMCVEIEGYYDGDTFMATKVIMEEYV